jgi:lipoate-protein ligase A
MRGNKILHHGTLLFDTKVDDVQKALMVSQDKYISKGIKSVRSRVTNISDYLVDKISIEEFEKILLEHMKAEAGSFKKYELSEDDIEKVNEIKENKYIKWDWTYGESPKFNLKKERKFAAGKIQALIDVEKGMIQSLKLYGDFFGNGDLSEIENKFAAIRYEESHLQKIVEEIDVAKYIKGLTSKELIAVIIG